jgi:hypothetical protein
MRVLASLLFLALGSCTLDLDGDDDGSAPVE